MKRHKISFNNCILITAIILCIFVSSVGHCHEEDQDSVFQGLTDAMIDLSIRNLKDKDPGVRRKATHLLGETGSERAVNALITALKDEDKEVRQCAAIVLGTMKDYRAIRPLVDVMKNDKDYDVRTDAKVALVCITDPAFGVKGWILAFELDRAMRNEAAWVLGRMGDPQSVGPLITAFKDEDPYIRQRAEDAIVAIGARAIEPLLAALGDKTRDPEGRIYLTFSAVLVPVVTSKDARAVRPLSVALKREYPSYVRKSAAWGLGEIGDLFAIKVLSQSAQTDSDPHVAKAAKEALLKIPQTNIDEAGRSLLHDAALDGNGDAVDLLIAKGADVNLTYDGFTPLDFAAAKGHKGVAELLIRKGASVEGGRWVKPLHLAAAGGHKEMVNLLIAKGADVNARNSDGLTPLAAALSKGHKDIAEILVRKGANIVERLEIEIGKQELLLDSTGDRK